MGARAEFIDYFLDPLPDTEAEEERSRLGFTLLLLGTLLLLCCLTAFLLRNTRLNRFIHESGAAILWGAFVGLLIRMFSEVETLQKVAKFDSDIFFFVFLPPIIFESGYTLRRRVFFHNIAGILAFAFAGTLITATVFGAALYGLVYLDLTFQSLSILECLAFGALISATDPVTVLAIFKALQVDKNLYANVFGESVFNDAVAIVLFSVVMSFRNRVFSVVSLVIAVALFFVIFIGSLVCGTIIGLFTSLVFKYVTNLRRYPILQTLIFFILAYCSYLLADALELSGIVSVLFCGITMAHYTYDNLSTRAQEMSLSIVKVAAFLSELFVFVYLGLALFSFKFEYDPTLLFWSILLCFITRVHVFPLSYLVNRWRKVRHAPNTIPSRHMIVMWFAGLRGAIAFALSLEVTTQHGDYIVSTTLFIVLATVLLMGSSTTLLLKALNVKMGPLTPEEIHAMGEAPPSRWQMFDQNYLKPFFIRAFNERIQNEEEDEDSRSFSSEFSLSSDQSEDVEQVEMVTLKTESVPTRDRSYSTSEQSAVSSTQEEEEEEKQEYYVRPRSRLTFEEVRAQGNIATVVSQPADTVVDEDELEPVPL